MNNELEGVWKEVFRTKFKVLSWHMPRAGGFAEKP
jgi:hypothetical protein